MAHVLHKKHKICYNKYCFVLHKKQKICDNRYCFIIFTDVQNIFD